MRQPRPAPARLSLFIIYVVLLTLERWSGSYSADMDMNVFATTPLLWILFPAAAAAIVAVYDVRYRNPQGRR
jgi:hypothetical protein